MKRSLLTLLALVLAPMPTALAQEEKWNWQSQQLADDLGVGYAVRVVDVNTDGKPDIVVVDRRRVLWYENPSWRPHVIIQDQTMADNVCIAPYDIDRDGQVDFALGAGWQFRNTQAGGTLQWLRRDPRGLEHRWHVYPIGREPTLHRINWADLDGDGRAELVVVPLFGPGATARANFEDSPLRVLAYQIPKDPTKDRWPVHVLNNELHVAHNFWPVDLDQDRRLDLLVASYEGVSWLRNRGGMQFERIGLSPGFVNPKGKKGASEIKLGRLGPGQFYLATIEPWHGNQVVVYWQQPGSPPQKWNRLVLDDRLEWGHAVWCANLDDDPAQELVIGVRNHQGGAAPRGVRIYDPLDELGRRWQRTLLEPGQMAVEDLVVADLDGNGRNDIVAVARQTHNLRIYWNRRK